jgi:hypothetical protein
MLPDESGKVFASLLLSEFHHAAMTHADEKRPYFLYLDECQNYLTGDAQKILDQDLKTGLRTTLAFHHMGQFTNNPWLQQSIDTNAKIKVIFAGLPFNEAERLAEEFFLPKLNERWIKEILYRSITTHIEEPYETNTKSEHGDSTLTGTRYAPLMEKEETGKVEWSREEKLSKLTERLMSLEPRHCLVKLPDKVFHYKVPTVKEYLLNPESVVAFEKALPTTAIPLNEAQRILKENEQRFLARSNNYDAGKKRPKKKPGTLF